MDTAPKTENSAPKSIASQYKEPDRAGRIIRNIVAVENDYLFAWDEISNRMLAEMALKMGKLAVDPWKIVTQDWTTKLTSPDWKMSRGVGTGDAWIELAEITSDEERDYSWVSAALSAGNTEMGLELTFRPGLSEKAIAAIKDAKSVEALIKLGFVRDADHERLFVPVRLSAELLAKGFEENDLDKALAPVVKATEIVIAAKAELDRLVNQVREAAKAK